MRSTGKLLMWLISIMMLMLSINFSTNIFISLFGCGILFGISVSTTL